MNASPQENSPVQMHATTVLLVRRPNEVVIAADGQVTLGQVVLKQKAVKLRRLYEGKIIAGFAGATADAFTLFERFENKLKDYSGNMLRAAVELTKDWRTDKMLRRLEAMLLVADNKKHLLLSGTGDVLEPDEDVIAIGSGGNFAYSSAYALHKHTELCALDIAKASMTIAAEICIYTNNNFQFETIKND